LKFGRFLGEHIVETSVLAGLGMFLPCLGTFVAVGLGYATRIIIALETGEKPRQSREGINLLHTERQEASGLAAW
jgi:hypothetical protein